MRNVGLVAYSRRKEFWIFIYGEEAAAELKAKCGRD